MSIRISTGMIQSAGVGTINQQTASLLHLQQQVASNKRILTPADDPVGAARALVVENSKNVVTQYGTNQDNAKSALGIQEAQLSSTNDLIARIRELAVQGGNAALSASDRKSLAFELRARYDELLGIANSDDGSGQYLFSGYQGATRPFSGSADAMIQNPALDVTYLGDDGQRRLQVSASRFMEVSDSGNDVFRRIRNGNGTFTTDYGRNGAGAATNTGTGVIDGGSVIDPAKWNASLTDPSWGAATPNQVSIKFWVDVPDPTTGTTFYGTPNAVYYDVTDSNGNSLFTDQPSTTPDVGGTVSFLPANRYQSGQTISLSGFNSRPDMGAAVTITGDPEGGSSAGVPVQQDSFTIAPSSTQSIFRTLTNLIGSLENTQTGTTAGRVALANEIGFALTNLDQANNNILQVRAGIGSRMNEIESLSSVNEDLKLQYQQTLSNILDLDYAKTISDLSRKQIDLEAAQKSYTMVARLSLFNYL
ncbi:MAG: flagellar hook-associated protein 3 [Rhodocyclaceae bacterium]|nr:flagellar hook-associated protein 3 [Rhodocyclaceae bacterium]